MLIVVSRVFLDLKLSSIPPGTLVSLCGSLLSYVEHRLVIGFYCLGILDLLGLVQTKTSETDRDSWREWIWEQQTRRYRTRI